MNQMKNMKLAINGERLWNSLMDLAKIGATPKGGNCRLALSKLDGQGRDLVVGWMKDAGLDITIDQMGNIFGRRPGKNNALPPVMTGSHIDTQPTGGKFDGCYGVLAGLEVMRTLQDLNIETEAPLEVTIWTNEEGARFAPFMMGSAVFTGKLDQEVALNTTDIDGLSVRNELQAIGYAGTAVVGGRPINAYYEAHIEQGPILENEDITIGVVTGSLGLRWYDVVVTGMEMHAGPTPMPIRKDALVGATYLIQEVIRIANDHQPHGRGTVGILQTFPGSRNVIPGQVKFSVDLRHENETVLDAMHQRWEQTCKDIADKFGLKVTSTPVDYVKPTPFATEMVATVREGAKAAGLSHMDIVTGAGHDAVHMASITPTAMIFVPCKDGISHNEIEDAKPAHLEAGANVLINAMVSRANGA
jgi:N-carbamoyl-L-amino-acid hydrolase